MPNICVLILADSLLPIVIGSSYYYLNSVFENVFEVYTMSERIKIKIKYIIKPNPNKLYLIIFGLFDMWNAFLS